jgi:hypothetical protein
MRGGTQVGWSWRKNQQAREAAHSESEIEEKEAKTKKKGVQAMYSYIKTQIQISGFISFGIFFAI